MQITIYSTTSCPYCNLLKDFLDEKKISYTEKFIDVDEGERAEMIKDSGGFSGVPFTVINFEDGRKETVIGFDKGKLNSVLGFV